MPYRLPDPSRMSDAFGCAPSEELKVCSVVSVPQESSLKTVPLSLDPPW